MKKFIVLFVALAVATSAFAADFSFSWDTDWGWASNFDDEYNTAFDELELAVAADIDEYNSFAFEMEPATGSFYTTYDVDEDGTVATDGTETEEVTFANIMGMNKMVITTDLGAYLGLSGIGLSWANGYSDLGGDEEYSDFGIVGLANSATDMCNIAKNWSTSLKLTSGGIWVQAASEWNLGVDSSDAATVNADAAREMQFFAGAVDLVPGLSIEAGVNMELDAEATNFEVDGIYAMGLNDATAIQVGGSFANVDDASSVYDAAYGKTIYGAGAQLDYTVDDMTGLYTSVSFTGNEEEAFQGLGGGAGVTYGDLGAEIAVGYDTTIDAGDADLAFVDISGSADIGSVTFRIGYVVTDYAADNSSRATIPAEGGAYFRVTADF